MTVSLQPEPNLPPNNEPQNLGDDEINNDQGTGPQNMRKGMIDNELLCNLVDNYVEEDLGNNNVEQAQSSEKRVKKKRKSNDKDLELEHFTDSDYELENDGANDNTSIDDMMFDKHVDRDAEWTCFMPNNDRTIIGQNQDNTDSDDDPYEEELVDSGPDFDSEVESDEEVERHPAFNPDDTFDPIFELGMLFSDRKEFRAAVQSHAIITRRNIKFSKNDHRRIYAVCANAKKDCGWRINALKVGGESTYQIKEYKSKHTCASTSEVKNLTSKWLARKYEEFLRTDPKRNVKGFRYDMIRDIKCNVTKYQAYRAKWEALKKIQGEADKQYTKLWDYAEEVRSKNPGSTVILEQVDSNDGSGLKLFSRLYVCFEALKKGFNAGCRPLIGVDGCHLKGPHGGILLTAITIDPNNNLYPLAYAVVCGETTDSWEWFLWLLKDDFMIYREDAYTFISDKQKGLIEAFKTVFPAAENRFCVRHLHGNMKKDGFLGLAYKLGLWNAAKASTIAEFERRMHELRVLNPKVVEWLKDKPPSQWSRSHFSDFPKCDMLLNNVCETFNSNILEAREKPILTMLEWIRGYIMKRLQENRDRARMKWNRKKICPRIAKIVEKNMSKVSDCIPLKSDNFHYEIQCFDGSRYIVDLHSHTCSCRKWDLSGIPCKHGLSAICHQNLDPEDFVNHYYSVETYNKIYATAIHPMNGSELWTKTGRIPPLPPNYGRAPGRPAKARRLEPDEVAKKNKKGKKVKQPQGSERMERTKFQMTCKVCGVKGHNRRTCKDTRVETPGGMGESIETPVGVEGNNGTTQAAIETPTEVPPVRSPQVQSIMAETSQPAIETPIEMPPVAASQVQSKITETSQEAIVTPVEMPPAASSQVQSKMKARKMTKSTVPTKTQTNKSSREQDNLTNNLVHSRIGPQSSIQIPLTSAPQTSMPTPPTSAHVPSNVIHPCSNVVTQSTSGAPVFKKGGKHYVTSSNLQVVAASMLNKKKAMGKKNKIPWL